MTLRPTDAFMSSSWSAQRRETEGKETGWFLPQFCLLPAVSLVGSYLVPLFLYKMSLILLFLPCICEIKYDSRCISTSKSGKHSGLSLGSSQNRPQDDNWIESSSQGGKGNVGGGWDSEFRRGGQPSEMLYPTGERRGSWSPILLGGLWEPVQTHPVIFLSRGPKLHTSSQVTRSVLFPGEGITCHTGGPQILKPPRHRDAGAARGSQAGLPGDALVDGLHHHLQ